MKKHISDRNLSVCVIGTGNGGQAMAGHFALLGYDVSLYGRNKYTVDILNKKEGIHLEGKIIGFGKLSLITNDIKKAIQGRRIILIATVANAHYEIALQLADFLEEGQIIVLNPGRTGGVLHFRKALDQKLFFKKIYLAEAQTLIYACRLKETGTVNIIGVKDKVLLSTLPAVDISTVLPELNFIFNCFIPAKNSLVTSLENIGAIFHPSVILFNTAAIERNEMFYFYREMTPVTSHFIEKLDEERLEVGKAYGIELINSKEWISYAYENVEGKTLMEKMRNNPAYNDIYAPTTIHCRQLTEDIPTGLLPIKELGENAGLKLPLASSIISICSVLLNIDFNQEGRTLDKMGLKGMSVDQIIQKIENDDTVRV